MDEYEIKYQALEYPANIGKNNLVLARETWILKRHNIVYLI
jgi:hypothetical protein